MQAARAHRAWGDRQARPRRRPVRLRSPTVSTKHASSLHLHLFCRSLHDFCLRCRYRFEDDHQCHDKSTDHQTAQAEHRFIHCVVTASSDQMFRSIRTGESAHGLSNRTGQPRGNSFTQLPSTPRALVTGASTRVPPIATKLPLARRDVRALNARASRRQTPSFDKPQSHLRWHHSLSRKKAKRELGVKSEGKCPSNRAVTMVPARTRRDLNDCHN